MENVDWGEEELVEEVTLFIQKLGGDVICIDPSNDIFKVELVEEKVGYAHAVIEQIIDKYRVNRARYLIDHPFERIGEIS